MPSAAPPLTQLAVVALGLRAWLIPLLNFVLFPVQFLLLSTQLMTKCFKCVLLQKLAHTLLPSLLSSRDILWTAGKIACGSHGSFQPICSNTLGKQDTLSPVTVMLSSGGLCLLETPKPQSWFRTF